MQDFRARAVELAALLEADPAHPADRELALLRAAWRGLDAPARAEAADAAAALAAASARRAAAAGGTASTMPALGDEEREAQLALKGLDRIPVEPLPTRAYDGAREPDALLEHFGLDRYRPGQREAVQAALDGRDSLVVMPTGGGKSLCTSCPESHRPTSR